MASLSRVEASPIRLSRAEAWLLFGVLAYGLWHLLWYWQTPLGRSPVLDEQENLQLAQQIATGTLAAEPFYRAVIYPLVLAPLFLVGVPAAWIPFFATGFGLLLHLIATACVGAIATRWFGRRSAGLIAMTLHGFNPVLLHYATQILDAVFGNTLFLLGLLLLVRSATDARPGRVWFAASLIWSLAALSRPQLLVLPLVFLPVAALLRTGPMDHARWRTLLVATAAGPLLFIVQGLAQWRISGDFRILPTQGAYNLWAANRPGANGRYFAQSIYLPSATAQENPARVESLVLYARESGDASPTLPEANTFWTRRFLETLRAQPLDVLQVQGRKLYYLLNDEEQYNNKTFAFHQARSPALRWNHLGWGVVWTLGLAGLVAGAPSGSRGRLTAAVLLLGGALAAGVMTGYVSGRFRLPLVAGLCCVSGGIIHLPAWWRSRPRPRRLGLALAGLLLAAFPFTRFGAVGDRSTHVQDHLLLAAAAERVGADAQCWAEAGQALRLAPGRPDALAMRVTSYFNLLWQGEALPAPEAEWWDAARAYLALPPGPRVPTVEATAALALWRAREEDAAARHLRRLAAGSTPAAIDALAVLVLTGLATPAEQARLSRASAAGEASLLTRLAGIDPAAEPGDSALAQALLSARERLRQRPADPPPPPPPASP